MTILVTGAAGFIGSHVMERLLHEGYDVVGLDNFDPYYSDELKLRNIENSANHPHCTFYTIDIRDSDALRNIFSRHPIETVIHLAAKAGVRPSFEHPSDYADVNVRGTLTLFEAMRTASVKKVLFASSSSVYGNQSKLPFSEDDPVSHPISPYAATKRAGELLCHTYHSAYAWDIWCLRFFTVYGPRQRPEMAIAKFLAACRNGRTVTLYGDGSMMRDFTYIEDIVDGLTNALSNLRGYEIVNLGGAHAYRLNELVDTIRNVSSRELDIEYADVPPGDVLRTVADTKKASRLISYNPRYTLEQGISLQWNWMQKENDVKGYEQGQGLVHPGSEGFGAGEGFDGVRFP